MKRLVLLIATILSFHVLLSQPYGNEWIDYDQSYYYFPIHQEGVYRIDYADLQAAGLPLTSLDPRNLQLFAGGEEMAIFVQGEADGSFDSGDYIEFYTKGNDGSFDEALYGSAAAHANPYYSLFNDTIYHYLTWNNSTNNLRYTLETDTNASAFTPLSYVWKEVINNYNFDYYDGKTESGGGSDPGYDRAEGWLDFVLNIGGTRVRPVSSRQRFTGGPPSEIVWKIIGQSDFSRLDIDHHLRVQFAGITYDTTYGGYLPITKKFTVPTSALGTNNTNITFRSINDLGSGADRSAVSFIKLRYPHLPNFDASSFFTFSVPDQSGQTKAFLNFTNFASTGNVWILDVTNRKKIRINATGTSFRALIPNAGNEKFCAAYSDGNVLSTGAIKAVSTTARFTDFTQEERSNAFLIITNSKLSQGASQYASYRNSTGYGSVTALLGELYHQFGYGIPKHVQAIRGFVDYVGDTWTEKPSYLFLLGKAVKADQHRKDASAYAENLVPTFGNPGSDILLTAGLDQNELSPLFPTGRLAANSNTEVINYLNKVQEFEGNTEELWMKNVLHFAGGKTGAEADRFVDYLKSYEEILKDTLFGGRVLTFKKSTSAPIQISLSDSIRGLIDNGSSILTFFGHASTTGGFDQNIDDPQNYNNKGKYPLLVGNSCFTGDIHLSGGGSISEEFVLIKDKGMIAFLASVDLGFESRLSDYSRNFFKSLGQLAYGSGIGDHMSYAIQQTENKGLTFPFRSVALLMTLHGDPSLVINAHEYPDYEITPKQVRTNPEVVTTVYDSLELNIQVFNIGKALSDSLGIEVVRYYPDQSSEVYTRLIAPVMYEGNTAIKIPVNAEKGAGFNRIDITLDPSDLIRELDETNNRVSIDLFIKSGDLIPVMPYNYAIIPEEGPVLKASTGFPLEELQEYEFQLDTNADFSNPIETFRVSSEGGVVTWKPSSLGSIPDSLVYFWRTRNTSGDENSIWRTSSFQYIPEKRGWSQDHFHQFRQNPKTFLEMNEGNRLFEFSTSVKKLTCQTSSTLNFSDLGDILYKLDAELLEYGGCGLAPAIHIAVLDSLTFEPWGTPYNGENPTNYFGQANFDGNCGKARVQNYFIFRANTPSQLAGMKDMLLNKVPNGNYILAWTWIRNDFSKWDAIDPTLRQVFANLGSDTITDINNDSLPYIFFVKKGKPGTKIEKLGPNYDEFIYLTTDLVNNGSFGNMTSTLVGPASQWDSLHWQYVAQTNDSLSLIMKGLASDQSTVMAQRTFKMGQKKNQINGLLSPASAPYIRMDGNFFDDNQSAPQLDRWLVLYEGVTELALNANEHYEFYNDSLAEGDQLSFSIAVKNISEYASDSVLVRYTLIDRNRNRTELKEMRMRPLLPDSSFIAQIEFNTLGMRGSNSLVVEVNPDFDQPEQHFFNNVVQINYFVQGDNTDPILDVTFDGVHILDGDIVSARPEIVMQLTDDNQFLILDDTSDFRVFVTDPSGLEAQYHFTTGRPDYTMQFIPASVGSNKARIILRPEFLEDGVYALRVQAKDRSNNESGASDYRITFEIINRSTITNLMNYPNPFSTSTKFVFVLTGSKVPDNLQIQIMTVSGKLVKTIDMGELGPIRIGRNITDYSWDGRDEYGDKLANGVYLYRVNTRLNGSDIEHRSTKADRYFKKGFGKMVILR